MGSPGAKQNDQVLGTDSHLNASGTPVPLPFVGMLSDGLSSTVKIQGFAAAIKGSVANNTTGHVSGAVLTSNKGEVTQGSSSVFFDGKAAARAGDAVKTCNDPQDLETSVIVAQSTVLIGG